MRANPGVIGNLSQDVMHRNFERVLIGKQRREHILGKVILLNLALTVRLQHLHAPSVRRSKELLFVFLESFVAVVDDRAFVTDEVIHI